MNREVESAASAADPYAKAKVKWLDGSHGIAYAEAGAGEDLVFVHGSLCDYRYWKPQLSELSADYRVIAPSLSHYYPRLPSSASGIFSWSAHVDQLGLFFSKLASPQLHLVGHSRGACIAYQAALRYPGTIASLSLIDPGGPNEQDDPHDSLAAEALATRQRATQLIAAGDIDEGLRLFVDSTSRPGSWDRSAPVFQNMARDNAATLIPQLADALPPYRSQQARGISWPTLLVQGEKSPAMYRRNAELLAQWIPGAASITIGGASHGMSWSHPQAFNRQLRAFLTGAAAQAR
jgi:pimeloyl-ACP methyl ester carboxylesterase